MKRCDTRLHRRPGRHRECARDSVADVDPMRVNVRIDNRTDVPMENWQDQLKRQRRKNVPGPGKPESSPPPGQQPPDGLIDEYAAPVPR